MKMKITDLNWAVVCESIAEKQELFDYATQRKVPVSQRSIYPPYRDDHDLAVGWWGHNSCGGQGLMAHEEAGLEHKISADEFRQLCNEYAT